jgi:hypothetical protein
MSEGPVGIANGTDWRAESRLGGSVLHGLVTIAEGAQGRIILYACSHARVV